MVVPPLERQENPAALPIKGISKVHELRLRGDRIYAKEFPCFKCTLATVCEDCAEAVGFGRQDCVNMTEEVDASLPPTLEADEGDNTDDEDSDEEDEEEEEEEDEEHEVGAFCWAPWGYEKSLLGNGFKLMEMVAK